MELPPVCEGIECRPTTVSPSNDRCDSPEDCSSCDDHIFDSGLHRTGCRKCCFAPFGPPNRVVREPPYETSAPLPNSTPDELPHCSPTYGLTCEDDTEAGKRDVINDFKGSGKAIPRSDEDQILDESSRVVPGLQPPAIEPYNWPSDLRNPCANSDHNCESCPAGLIFMGSDDMPRTNWCEICCLLSRKTCPDENHFPPQCPVDDPLCWRSVGAQEKRDQGDNEEDLFGPESIYALWSTLAERDSDRESGNEDKRRLSKRTVKSTKKAPRTTLKDICHTKPNGDETCSDSDSESDHEEPRRLSKRTTRPTRKAPRKTLKDICHTKPNGDETCSDSDSESDHEKPRRLPSKRTVKSTRRAHEQIASRSTGKTSKPALQPPNSHTSLAPPRWSIPSFSWPLAGQGGVFTDRVDSSSCMVNGSTVPNDFTTTTTATTLLQGTLAGLEGMMVVGLVLLAVWACVRGRRARGGERDVEGKGVGGDEKA